MTSEEIIKPIDYKKGHFNMVQYILREKPEWSISVYDIEEDRYPVEKSKDYQQIKKAIKDYTGARGLRSIIEALLMETMYKVPSEESLSKVVLDGAVVRGETEPLMVYEKTSKTKTG
jgi:ATP-dependent Clp protease ATP-binding subunit ClpX